MKKELSESRKEKETLAKRLNAKSNSNKKNINLKEKNDNEVIKNKLNRIMKENLQIKIDSQNYRNKIDELGRENIYLNETILNLKLNSSTKNSNEILQLIKQKEEIDFNYRIIKEQYEEIVKEKENLSEEIKNLKNQLSELSINQSSNESIERQNKLISKCEQLQKDILDRDKKIAELTQSHNKEDYFIKEKEELRRKIKEAEEEKKKKWNVLDVLQKDKKSIVNEFNLLKEKYALLTTENSNKENTIRSLQLELSNQITKFDNFIHTLEKIQNKSESNSFYDTIHSLITLYRSNNNSK